MRDFWTGERIDDLKRLFKDGLNGTQIAAEIGAVSRNSVLGKLHRLGLLGTQPRLKRTKISAEQRQHRGARSGGLVNKIKSKIRQRRDGDEDPVFVAPHVDDVARVSIMELTQFTCRWPVGNPGMEGFGYCGNGVHREGPYCSGHAWRAHV